jgi:hypothetical protein
MRVKINVATILGVALGITVAGKATASELEGVGIGSGQPYSIFNFSFTEYIGECTGSSYYGYFEDVKLWIPSNLVGSSIPEPQKNRRVRIINRSNGGAYTDREWEQPPDKYLKLVESEGFKMAVTDGHNNSHFGLKIGENDLITVFYEGKFNKEGSFKELATAEFKVKANSVKKTETVNRQLSAPIVECAENPSITGSAITPENCPGNRQQVQYLSCPSWTSAGLPRERRVITTLAGPLQQQQQQQPGSGSTVIIVK